ncbi:MAG TPA: RNA polymerase sigma factor [Terriglobales bacterium]|nr:RNA polymerase sigma factor [Terriglobales bacterium]
MKENSDSGSEFERLATPLFDSLYNFARWLSGDEAEADDLVQEAFTKALRGFASFTPGTDFRAWIFRILRNTFLTSRTGLRAKLTDSLDEDEGEIIAVTWETPESLAVAAATRDALQAALERLPAPYREVILLCDVEEMKYKEIAEVLLIPIGTVMSRVARGRKLLRQSLAGERPGWSASAGKMDE